MILGANPGAGIEPGSDPVTEVTGAAFRGYTGDDGTAVGPKGNGGTDCCCPA